MEMQQDSKEDSCKAMRELHCYSLERKRWVDLNDGMNMPPNFL